MLDVRSKFNIVQHTSYIVHKTSVMRKHFTCLLFSFIFIVATSAQKFSVNFSDRIESQSGIFEGGMFLKSLPVYGEGVLSLFVKERRKMFSSQGLTQQYMVLKFDKNLGLVNEFEIDKISANSTAFIDFVKIQDKYYFLLQQYDKGASSLTITATELNPKNMTTGKPKNIATFDVSSDRNGRSGLFSTGASAYNFDADIIYSRDSIKIGIVYFPVVKNKEEKTVQFYVFDKNMNNIVSKNYNFGVEEKKIEVNDFDVDISGKFYINYDLYDEKDTKSFKKEDGEKVPSYTAHLKIFDNKDIKDLIIDNSKKFIKKVHVGYDADENIIIYGLYKDVYRGEYRGVCGAALKDLSSSNLSFTFNEFPQELLDLVDHDNMGKNSGDKKGIGTDFFFRHIITTSDNNIHLILEYISLKESSSQGRTIYRKTYGDIVVVTYNPDNSVKFQRIPKLQEHTYEGGYNYMRRFSPDNHYLYSFYATYFKNKLMLFYNDDEDNIERDINKKADDMINPKKSALTCASLTQTGELIKREMVFSHRDMDKYMTSSTFYEIAPNTYALFALKFGAFTYGTKIGKLTIK